MENRNRQVLLKRRPPGAPTPDDFEIAEAPMPDPGEGEVLVRGIYLSLDPYMGGRISGGRSYAKPVEVGAVMEGRVELEAKAELVRNTAEIGLIAVTKIENKGRQNRRVVLAFSE
jgi:NADPH-dependent curcumin reductase